MPGLENLAQDPQPAAKRRPGRPAGSVTKKRTATKAAPGDLTKAQLKAKVKTELYAFASMGFEMWEINDPDCAGPWLDSVNTPYGEMQRLEAIIDRMVDIMARNDSVLEFFAKTGVIGEGLMLGQLLMKPIKALIKAHGPGGTGHRRNEEEIASDYQARYPAPALA